MYVNSRLPMIFILLVASTALTAGQTRKVTTRSDTGRVITSTTDSASEILELRCRGGALDIKISPLGMRELDLWTSMNVRFTHASAAAGLDGSGLGPGQCALSDRALLSSEPSELRGEIIDFGQRNRKMHGDPVYVGDMAAERYPDAHNVPTYLSDANHYWSFFGTNVGGYFHYTNSHYWKPFSSRNAGDRLRVPASDNRVVTPDSAAANKVRTPAGSMKPADPVPANAVRVYVRYKSDLGYVGIGGGGLTGSPGPYSCDAFNVDANPNVGLGQRSNGDIRGLTNPTMMRVEANDYVCAYTVEYLPQNVPISVTARMVNEARFLTNAWSGPGSPRPPSGYERSILRGVQSVILTRQNPSEIVTFEMVYAPAVNPPR